jgi:hypothetical protein
LDVIDISAEDLAAYVVAEKPHRKTVRPQLMADLPPAGPPFNGM